MFFNEKQMSPPFRNRKITKLHLVMILSYKGNNLKNLDARFMVLIMHDTLSECALQMYEVSLKYH